jgi:hypothetical protein
MLPYTHNLPTFAPQFLKIPSIATPVLGNLHAPKR